MVVESPGYQDAWPEVEPSRDQWTKSLFMNTVGGGRMACTVGGMSPTGFHAHFIIVDDPLDPQQAKRVAAAELDSANNFMSEVIPTRKVNKEVAITWLVMQRLHQNDPTGYLLGKGKGGGYRHICLPAERSNKVKPPRLRRRYVGGLMDPVRLSTKVLAEARVDLGEYGYAGQYGQHPVPKSGGMFKAAKFEIEPPPHLTSRQWVGIARGWDKAGTKDGGAYTAGVRLGRWRPAGAPKDGSEDLWWVLHVERGQWDSFEREKVLKQTTVRDKYGVVVIEQEPGSGGKESAQLTVRRLAGYRVVTIPAHGSKEDRADAWSTQVNAGAFRLAPGEWNEAFLEELKYFPYGTYKDQVDAGSHAFAYLAKPPTRVGAR